MSAGLMSCVRENSPPIAMEDSGAASMSSESQENQKRRRRFHPLRNLRRIFRRRTVAHADSIRPIVQQHDFSRHHHNHQQPNDTLNTTTTTISTIRSFSSQSIGDVPISTSGKHYQQRYLMTQQNPSSATTTMLPSSKRSFYSRDKRDHHHHHHHHHYLIDSGGSDTNSGNDLEREMTDYQRSLSEGRLVDNDLSRERLSQSHDSVFSESATASSSSIVLKAELSEVLRKRKSRSDASDEDLGLPRSPSTPQRNGQHVVDGTSHGTNGHGRHHHSSLGLLSVASTEIEDDGNGLHNYLALNKSSHNTKMSSDELFPDMSADSNKNNEVKLNHSAAKHKMAVRPRRKGPSRPTRKQIDTNVLPSTPEVNENFFKLSSNELIVPKSQSLPQGMSAKAIEKSNIQNTLKSIGKSSKSSLMGSKSKVQEAEHKQKDYLTSSSQSLKKSTVTKAAKDSEHSHSEEGFFRRFINRSGRKNKKERQNVEKETSDTNKHAKAEYTAPIIKKSEELSILNVLSKARANDKPIDAKFTPSHLSVDDADGMMLIPTKTDKPRSGPAARQRVLPQDITTLPVIDLTDTGINDSENQPETLLPISKNMVTSTAQFLRAEINGTQYHSHSDLDSTSKPIRHSQYRSEEILHSNRCDNDVLHDYETTAPHSVPLQKTVWPQDSKEMPNVSRSNNRWNHCQHKISRLTDHELRHTKSPAKGKLVEKSKSFRVYTKHDASAPPILTPNEFRSLAANIPSLPDLSDNKKLEYRENLKSLSFIRKHMADTEKKSKPLRNSMILESLNNAQGSEFEINDYSLVSKPKTTSRLLEDGPFKTENSSNTTTSDTRSTSIVVTSRASNLIQSATAIQNHNINEIEDNIDKIMKSSFVTVLKKSPTAELYQIQSSPSNVSLTTIINVKENDERDNGLSVASVENPPLLRHSMTTSKLDVQKSKGNVPEFMQVQLNRIDTARPKSFIEYSSGTPASPIDEDKERRFSNESIEITDNKKSSATSTLRNSVFGNQNPTKSSDLSKEQQRLSSNSNASKLMHRDKSIGELNKMSHAGNVSDNDCVIESEFDDNDDSSPSNDEMGGGVIVERRKSVSDKKLKFEKKIEEIKAELERSSISGNTDKLASSRKMSIDDESNAVILRNKNSSKSENDDDPTPELMKVFARRSLKIKDSDEYLTNDEDERQTLNSKMNNNSNNKNNDTVNNNKDNNTENNNNNNNQNEYNTSNTDHSINNNKNCNNAKKLNDINNNDKYNQNKIRDDNYKNNGNNVDVHDSNIKNNHVNQKNKRNSEIVNTNFSSKTSSSINNSFILNNDFYNNSNNKSKLLASARSTITGTSVLSEMNDDDNKNGDEVEFKGILERKAEWEKRINKN